MGPIRRARRLLRPRLMIPCDESPSPRNHSLTHERKGAGGREQGEEAMARERRIDWDAQPLGQVPDVELAQRLGVSKDVVGYARRRRGIAKTPKSPERKLQRNWGTKLLGEVADVVVARALGVSRQTVWRERRKRGIGAPRKTWRDWDGEPLGREKDSIIAQRLNTSPKTVACERRSRGIPPFRPPPAIDWMAQPLGQVPDNELARQLGVSIYIVLRARKKLGIARARRVHWRRSRGSK